MSRKILIYGGTGGIGSAIGHQLQSQGDEIYLVGRNAERSADLLAKDGVHFINGDVTREGVFDRIMEEVGPELNGLVYAIGSIHLGSLRRLGEEDFIRDFQLNAMGAALAVKASLKALKKGGDGGSIVLFSSVAALQGFPLHMAKGAVSGL
jgi:NAD(P)-dependent dehydrogenase (short-subunit alcohol dehydrogenase family)